VPLHPRGSTLLNVGNIYVALQGCLSWLLPHGQRGKPVRQLFSDLDAAAAAKVSVALVRLVQGNTSNAKGVGEGVLEYRIDWGPGYRVYFGRDGETLVILLTGGTKQRQQRDIERTKELWADDKRRRKPPAR
jgi:putative addiction module killer protein